MTKSNAGPRRCFFLVVAFSFFFLRALFAAVSSDTPVVGPEIRPEEHAYSDEEIAALNESAEKIALAPKAPAGASGAGSFGKSLESSNEFEPPSSSSKKKASAAKAGSGKSAPGSYEALAEEYGFKPEAAPAAGPKKKKGTQMGMVRVWGRYRLAGGANGEDFILNDSNSVSNIMGLQGPQSDYLFGEKLNNTYDKAIFSQYLLNVNFEPAKNVEFYSQIVIDPWSWSGTTGDQVTRCNQNSSIDLRYNLKYFGAFNSTIKEVYRNQISDRVNFPYIKAHDGELTAGTVVQGMDDYDGVPGNKRGLSFNIPRHDINTDLRPFRKMWLDYKETDWHVRLFALADESQALTTDDPLELSNHRDYWQQSPWLYQYKPIKYFNDGSVKRGYYSDALSYFARDSEGNRLVLLRGISYEAKFDKTYIAATVAAPYTPWDDKYFSPDNIPGAVRLKQQVTDRLMLGSVYTFRTGLIDNSAADFNQVLGVDTEYAVNDNVSFIGEVAGSHREIDMMTNDTTRTSTEGYAYKAALRGDYDHKYDGHSEWQISYAQMDRHFEPRNSNYLNTRDDRFWGTHISFDEHPDMDPFKLGDGLDVNRWVVRAQWKEKLFKERFFNEFDIRNVHKVENTKYVNPVYVYPFSHWEDADSTNVETVLRDEITIKLNPRVTAKGLFRWRMLPRTQTGVDPSFTGFYFPKEDTDLYDFYVANSAVTGGQNADQFTYSGGLQYIIDANLTVETIYERTNAIPDFPRGLLNDFYRNPIERVDGIATDRMQNFMYYQGGVLKAAPPYAFFNITKERLIYKPESRVTYTLHATQNGYKAAGGIDDNINHVGLGVEFVQNKKLKWFTDYTYSHQIDLARYIDTNEREANYDGHHNFYASFDYQLNAATLLRGEYGVFLLSAPNIVGSPYNAGTFSLPTIDTEQLFRVSLTGEF